MSSHVLTVTSLGRWIIGALLLTAAAATLRSAETDDKENPARLNAELLSGIKLRAIGPALMSGRIADVAIDALKPNTWYVAAGSGNLWKTVNAGTTWTPIFEAFPSYSIGCVTIDPANSSVVWVGTGENVGGRHVGYGDGVYRSRDGGGSFENLGLTNSEHIARILLDPRDSDVVYVAAQGPLWSSGGDRGLFKSSDGGGSWENVLAKGPYTGVTDVVMDPLDPDVLYAATHQRHRTVWALVNGGPESGIHKSVDGGQTWRELKRGLPGEDKGKIALAVSPQRPEVVYASIELAGRKGGFWRSEDGGESWVKMNDIISGGTGPHYYQELFCDPFRFDTVYQVDVELGRTEDGGKTWATVESDAKHVDNHVVAFHPTDPDFLLVGCDGGLYRSLDRGETFEYYANLPLTQFYKVDVDYAEPFYHIVGGTQDNSTQYGPSRTANNSGLRNSDWQIVMGGDGHDCAIDPEDPDILYGESQEGYLRRVDLRTGETTDIRPRPEVDEEELRFNWDSPILISPHDHNRLYFGSKKLHRSDDRGDSWTVISPDLSRGLERYRREQMDRVWSIDAVYDTFAMSQYGNLTCVSESPVQEGLIYVGTDDGLIQVTEDGGENWRRVERIYGIPEEAFVNDIKADRHEADVVYAVLDHHKTGDYRPYLVRSSDRGRTWTSVVGDLSERQILWRFEQDHVLPNLWFVGAEFGLYVSLDSGEHWIQLKGDVPTIPFRDLAIQRRENDLVGATFGRGFFVLDDYSFLRELSEPALQEQAFLLFAPRRALLYAPARPLGGEQGTQGDGFFVAPNPPDGAVFTYYLKDSLKTRRQERQDSERKTQEKGGDNPPPSWEQLAEEELEEEPTLTLVIRDADGELVNRIGCPTEAGLHRVAWNLCRASVEGPGDRGAWVRPGVYHVRAERRVRDEVTVLGEGRSVEVEALQEPAMRGIGVDASAEFYATAGELQRVVRGSARRLAEVLEELTELKAALGESSRATPELWEQTRRLELRLLGLQELLVGNTVKSRVNEPEKVSISSRIRTAMSGQRSTYGPTVTHRREADLARRQLSGVLPDLRQGIEVDYLDLQKAAEAAGVPWTPGRPVPGL